MVGVWTRQRESVWVWRWVDSKETILERWEGRVLHVVVLCRSLVWWGDRAGEERWEESMRINSRRSGGRVACVCGLGGGCWV